MPSLRLSAGWAWKPDFQTREALARGQKHHRAMLDKREAKYPVTRKTPMSNQNAVSTAAPKKTPAKKVAPKKTPVKKAAVKKVATPTKKAATSVNGLIPLKKLLPASMDARLARKKLRDAKLNFHLHGNRWEFTADQAKRAREVLGI